MTKKIKLVLSDLHLGLGRLLEDGRSNHLEEFYFDEKFREFVEYYTKGKYADYEIEIILNGDIFNFIQVDYKGHFLTVITEDISLEKFKNIAKGHKVFFETLKHFAADPKHSVSYVVGNHDQGMLWPKVRNHLDELLETKVIYKNIVYYFDGVHIEHGHMHEAANRIDPRKFYLKKNLPEPILNLPFGSYFFLDFVLKVKQKHPHVDKVRPFSKMLKWALINETFFTISNFCKLVWYFVSSFLKTDGTRSWTFQDLIQIILESAIFPDLGDSAKKILNDSRIHTVIFGHTHVYQYRQFSNGKEYFNTGTWTDLTSLDITSLGKITKLTYVLLEYPEDGEGQPRGRLKEWKGYHRIEEDVVLS